MKSIEELAREFVNGIEGSNDTSMIKHWAEFTALKSALEKPVEKETEWPQWYTCHGDLYKFDGPNEDGARWSAVFQEWGHLGKAYPLNDLQLESGVAPIPTAEALAIIEKAKIK